jgi:hypothetical protein
MGHQKEGYEKPGRAEQSDLNGRKFVSDLIFDGANRSLEWQPS